MDLTRSPREQTHSSRGNILIPKRDVRVCPNCFSADLAFSPDLASHKYRCKECGYKGTTIVKLNDK